MRHGMLRRGNDKGAGIYSYSFKIIQVSEIRTTIETWR